MTWFSEFSGSFRSDFSSGSQGRRALGSVVFMQFPCDSCPAPSPSVLGDTDTQSLPSPPVPRGQLTPSGGSSGCLPSSPEGHGGLVFLES